MALTREQVQRLRQMPPEERKVFHTNRIATSLEAIAMLLREINRKLGGPSVPASAPQAETPEDAEKTAETEAVSEA